MATVESANTNILNQAQTEEEVDAARPVVQVNAADEEGLESETEDEEVKMNCIGGYRGADDSDMNTTDHDDDSLSDDEVDTSGRGQGVVKFVQERVGPYHSVVRPQATSPSSRGSKPLSPLEEDDGSESSNSSIGARGVALSLGTGSATMSESQDDDLSELPSDSEEEIAEEARNPFHDPGYNAENEDTDEELEDHNDDELDDILETLGQSEQDDSPLAGVTNDRDDYHINIPKAKRVLSFNTLAALNSEIERIRGDSMSPKRAKHVKGYDDSHGLIGFSLGASAMDESFSMSPVKVQAFRDRESPLISSSDDEALDRQLEDELGDGVERSQDNSPVPLLTPPDSPLTIEINGDRAMLCEWPSNLAVDSAMAAAMYDKRPLSPASLNGSSDEEDAKERVASALTPLLMGISVGK
jgi:hypothetical protein